MTFIDICQSNIDLISKNSNKSIAALRITEKDLNGVKYQLLKKNGLFRQLCQKALLLFDKHKKHRIASLREILSTNIEQINHLDRSAFVKEDSAYSELFIAAQRYNKGCQLSNAREDVRLFHDLELREPIAPTNCSELAPIILKAAAIAANLQEIPQNQQPIIHQEGLWKKHTVYHYNDEDIKIRHQVEGLKIFLDTQLSRFISIFGDAIETVAHCLKIEIERYRNYHYFRKGEDKKEDTFAKDAPIAVEDKPTSYWIGHATCLLSVPVKTDSGNTIKLNLLTDPVEHDINKILYPRMTSPARSIESCPVPHIYMLSHNHLDHFDVRTIQKLKQQQPIMLVPEGDAEKFRKMGFKNIYEHNWWQKTTIEVEQNGQKGRLKITAVPARHWSGQGACDGHHSTFLGYIVHLPEGDIYFAGDTARLSEDHIATLRDRFNIRSMFQPGGPDDKREYMESTHQASVDGLWMHFNLMVRKLYEKRKAKDESKEAFIAAAKELRTVYMHTKTYKLGDLHFDDTDLGVQHVKDKLSSPDDGAVEVQLQPWERQVYQELIAIGEMLQFADGSYLEAHDIREILDSGVIIPKIGSRTNL